MGRLRRGKGPARLLLPGALLVTIRLQALPTLVLVHLQTTLLFQIAHVVRRKNVFSRVCPVKDEIWLRACLSLDDARPVLPIWLEAIRKLTMAIARFRMASCQGTAMARRKRVKTISQATAPAFRPVKPAMARR